MISEEGFNTTNKVPHYYGDVTRVFFIIIGVIMLFTLPFFEQYIPIPLYASIIIILFLVLLAGFTNPKNGFVLTANSIASLVGFLVFEYYAVTGFNENIWFAITNQILAILCFTTIYFSSKTLRGYWQRKRGSSDI